LVHAGSSTVPVVASALRESVVAAGGAAPSVVTAPGSATGGGADAMGIGAEGSEDVIDAAFCVLRLLAVVAATAMASARPVMRTTTARGQSERPLGDTGTSSSRSSAGGKNCGSGLCIVAVGSAARSAGAFGAVRGGPSVGAFKAFKPGAGSCLGGAGIADL
jgi:hypothetical protein